MKLKEKPPITRRRFASLWVELEYLCRKVHYWLYTRKNATRADQYRDRLQAVLSDLPRNDIAIIRQEGHALLCQLNGNVGKAIRHRTREIELIERLHEIASDPKYDDGTRAYMLQGHDAADLQERRKILESLKLQKRGGNGNGFLKK
ncbi:MAG: hypothetical protein HYR84_01850 [Planctomycetes bacterium]|nr:hypothetical protein [Planctomycetota bacterium]